MSFEICKTRLQATLFNYSCAKDLSTILILIVCLLPETQAAVRWHNDKNESRDEKGLDDKNGCDDESTHRSSQARKSSGLISINFRFILRERKTSRSQIIWLKQEQARIIFEFAPFTSLHLPRL